MRDPLLCYYSWARLRSKMPGTQYQGFMYWLECQVTGLQASFSAVKQCCRQWNHQWKWSESDFISAWVQIYEENVSRLNTYITNIQENIWLVSFLPNILNDFFTIKFMSSIFKKQPNDFTKIRLNKNYTIQYFLGIGI